MTIVKHEDLTANQVDLSACGHFYLLLFFEKQINIESLPHKAAPHLDLNTV